MRKSTNLSIDEPLVFVYKKTDRLFHSGVGCDISSLPNISVGPDAMTETTLAQTYSNRRRIFVGLGTVFLIAIGHTIHDVMIESARPLDALLPSIPLALGVAALSEGHALALRHSLPTWVMLAAAAFISLLFGGLFVILHSQWPTVSEKTLVSAGLASGLMIWGLWALIFRFPLLLRDARAHALVAENLRREAELARLRSSLHPHFLLNTLHAIAGLLGDNPQEARRLLATLGDLLRDSLEDGPQLRSFSEEVAWLQRYAELLEIRHQGRLRFEWKLTAESMNLSLPRLLIQPLLENATKHGALAREEDGVVTLQCRIVDRGVELVVEDNGPGLAPDFAEGLGLSLVRERLKLSHPKADLRLESSSAGTRAVIEIPTSARGIG